MLPGYPESPELFTKEPLRSLSEYDYGGKRQSLNRQEESIKKGQEETIQAPHLARHKVKSHERVQLHSLRQMESNSKVCFVFLSAVSTFYSFLYSFLLSIQFCILPT